MFVHNYCLYLSCYCFYLRHSCTCIVCITLHMSMLFTFPKILINESIERDIKRHSGNIAQKFAGHKFSFGSHAFPGVCIRRKTMTHKKVLCYSTPGHSAACRTSCGIYLDTKHNSIEHLLFHIHNW